VVLSATFMSLFDIFVVNVAAPASSTISTHPLPS
jgi:hypothetical protein